MPEESPPARGEDGSGGADGEDAALLAALLEAAADAVVIADAEGRIRRANAAAGALFGRPARSLVGRSVDALMPRAYAERHGAFIRHHLATGERRVIGRGREVEGRRADGTVFPVHIALGRAETADGPRFVAVLHDLSRRRAAEAALARSERMDALGRMTGGVAHDFNNLLTIVIGNLELLEPALREGDRAMLRDALEAAEIGAGLTERLLAFARRGALSPERLKPAAAVEEAVALLRRTIGPRVALAAEARTEAEVEVDRARLGSALVNLALNARDAMPGGGRLLFETREVAIDDDYVAQETDVAPGRYVRVSVSDTGAGMDAGTRARAFEPFFTTKPPGRGTGFGLAMVYGFVRQSGGHVTLYSEPGQGTTVSLYFPVAGEAPATEGLEAPGGALPLGRGERVLVVEDDAAVRRLARLRLEALGYRVEEAGSGDEALRRLDDGPMPDAVFTDLVMPGAVSGLELARRLGRDHPEVAVLLTSGYAGMVVGHEEGAMPALLRKPFRQADLAVRLRAALDARPPPP